MITCIFKRHCVQHYSWTPLMAASIDDPHLHPKHHGIEQLFEILLGM